LRSFFFLSLCFPHTSPPEIYTLSLHDALPILCFMPSAISVSLTRTISSTCCFTISNVYLLFCPIPPSRLSANVSCSWTIIGFPRSEEHTSELQSRFDLVCRLLLEKKKQSKHIS